MRIETIPEQLEMSLPVETRAQNKADLQDAIELLLKELAACQLL
jgi:hypothetical protein